MLLAVISDTHLPRGTRRIPDPCLAALSQSDLILHAGDFTYPDVLDELEALGPPVVGVHGNVDAEELRRRLPAQRVVDAGGVKIGMLHDAGPSSGRLERMRLHFPEAAAVVFGHSHIPLHEQAGGFHIFNPGSPTDKRRQPYPTMGIARIQDGQITFAIHRVDDEAGPIDVAAPGAPALGTHASHASGAG